MRATIGRMTDTLVHRGPDDSGIWCHAEAGIALGHRRLSILDLSPEGHQPMTSFTGRYVLVFNGEIYNHAELRGKLAERAGNGSFPWRGHSDTEVILAAFEAWGMEAVECFVGMFAFALWDRQERTLHLVRDRLGEKPLYYGKVGNAFLFGSELKPLRAYPAFKQEINRDALALYVRHSCIPAPHSIYRGVYKLLPGTILSVKENGNSAPFGVLKHYWHARTVSETGVLEPYLGTHEQAVAELDALLREVIRCQMVADVPIGAFLSGGIDSSLVVALMQAQSQRPVRTFTIGFTEEGYNEAAQAKAVAHHLGTDHNELYVSSADALAVIPQLPLIYDEPFSDPSQIPACLLSRLTRKHVTVSLSGDGGDELFAGYNRHLLAKNFWGKAGRLPAGIRNLVSRSILAISPEDWNTLYRFGHCILPPRYRVPVPGHSIHKLADILSVQSPEELYVRLVSQWNDPAGLVKGAAEPSTAVTGKGQCPDFGDVALRMMYLDLVTYLPDDILVKVDRAGMSVGLESRIPFLDRRLVEFAWRLPLSMKIREGKGKWILRQLLRRYVPETLVERPKAGFAVPIDSWLRGPLRDWAEALLGEKRLEAEGYFHPTPVILKWKEHLSGKRNWQYHLWNVLMFQSWLDNEKGGA